jgi:hypothetical protein
VAVVAVYCREAQRVVVVLAVLAELELFGPERLVNTHQLAQTVFN